MRFLKIVQFSYQVTVKSNGAEGKPLPHMNLHYLTNSSSQPLSFWNDVPINLQTDTVTCCIEIPKETCGKLQVEKSLALHPFRQDTKKNIYTSKLQLRYYAQFPLFNYGFIPQTWEQNITKNEAGLFGDDDPIDVCQLSQHQKTIGDIFQAKILGSFCLIDQGEIDWKVLLFQSQEAKLKNINTISDLDPRRIRSVMNWFKGIKVFQAKKPNTIAHNQKIFSKEETIEIIKDTHKQWANLLASPQKEYASIRKKYHMELSKDKHSAQ